ncbi:pirin family protein [Aeromicrobium sp. 636]|uniref:Pirin family protein n=1 Tax=Aeromicrobium senzhongii TaxID=2663859 RepID=A0A8I0EVL1_9ACTN|nr:MULTISPECIES: pirin family protein [Aeromicrobium]MBC9225962.1 pirin family protein [Aeromicrobium senzhongii]MCQ3998069.1 pirin family protein [Aeromicrobium sp. 636]
MITDRTIEPRDVPLGGLRGLRVHRTLPSRPLPTIGAWCFVDHFGPTGAPMAVLPHPHTGLQTVTWPIEGSIRHRDSLGSDVVLRPGELNLMTSGDGVSHSEFSDPGPMHGIQLWVALPEHRRHGPADFEHHPDLPRVGGDGWEGVVLVGRFGGGESRATVHTPLVGVELRLQPGRHVFELDSAFEYGVLAVDGDATVAGQPVAQRALHYLAPGRAALAIEVERPTLVMLLGGEPFEEEIVMWWNFIGRTHEEVVAAREQWQALDPRFGRVEGHDGVVIPAPPLPRVRMTPRTRRD